MHTLVKILYNEDGIKEDNPQWHLVVPYGDSPRTVCTGEVFGYGEGSAVYEKKVVNRGVPCPRCLEIVKFYKSIKL